MKNHLKALTALTALYALPGLADVTLTYELSSPMVEPQTKIISISRFFARIDDPKTPDTYLVYQAGKFFPLYQVDKSASTYTRLTPEVKVTLHAGQIPNAQQPEEIKKQPAPVEQIADASENSDASDKPTMEKPAPQQPVAETEKPPLETKLRLTKKTNTISGVRCRVVEELQDGKPIMRHCMADQSRLGITEREVRTLARVFEMARNRDYHWLGSSSKDEKFVSIATKDLQTGASLELKTHSIDPLEVGYLRIPRAYKQVEGTE